MSPKESLLAGVRVLDDVLGPAGFHFVFREEGRGSGGHFAWGEYVRDRRRLELHFRYALGLITLHDAENRASYEAYMRELGVWEQCRFRGSCNEPLEVFDHLAADLRLAGDFLFCDASVLRRAAARERVSEVARHEENMARNVGDTAALEKLRAHFRAQRFREVISTFEQLFNPQRLSPSDLKMVELARKRAGG